LGIASHGRHAGHGQSQGQRSGSDAEQFHNAVLLQVVSICQHYIHKNPACQCLAGCNIDVCHNSGAWPRVMLTPAGSALAVTAEYTGALSELRLPELAATLQTRQPATAIDEQLLLKVTGLAITTDKILQCGATLLDGPRQH